jgi:osmotically-inducible protein OsmY
MNTAVVVNHNSDLERRIRKTLEHKNVLAVRSVTIEPDGATVKLKGCVKSYYTRQLLVHGCLGVPGVRTVIDEISVSA